MRLQKDNPVIVVTNPLHFVHFFRKGGKLPVIGSSQETLYVKYGQQLLEGTQSFASYPVSNRIEPIIDAHKKATNEDVPYITWKAVDSPGRLLGNQLSVRNKLESKANVRVLLDRSLFPAYAIIEKEAFVGLTYKALVEMVASKRLVLQVDFSTGGRGTYFINNEADFVKVLPHVLRANQSQSVVVSRKIQGASYAVQCFTSGSSVVHMNWWHRDLVGLEGVCNLTLPMEAYQTVGTTLYAGAILQNIPEQFVGQVRELMQKVGRALINEGYMGVFGVDIVVDEQEEKVYLIEVNARFTAVSALYASAMDAVGCKLDFLTAHIQQLVKKEDQSFDGLELRLPHDLFYLKLQNLADADVRVHDSCKLAIYKYGEYQRFGFEVADLRDQDEIIVIPEGDIMTPYHPGDRVFSVIGKGNPLTAQGQLKPRVLNAINLLRDAFIS